MKIDLNGWKNVNQRFILFENIHVGLPVNPPPPHISSWSKQLSTLLNGLVSLTGKGLLEKTTKHFQYQYWLKVTCLDTDWLSRAPSSFHKVLQTKLQAPILHHLWSECEWGNSQKLITCCWRSTAGSQLSNRRLNQCVWADMKLHIALRLLQGEKSEEEEEEEEEEEREDQNIWAWRQTLHTAEGRYMITVRLLILCLLCSLIFFFFWHFFAN